VRRCLLFVYLAGADPGEAGGGGGVDFAFLLLAGTDPGKGGRRRWMLPDTGRFTSNGPPSLMPRVTDSNCASDGSPCFMLR